jgi:hypothetical protein
MDDMNFEIRIKEIIDQAFAQLDSKAKKQTISPAMTEIKWPEFKLPDHETIKNSIAQQPDSRFLEISKRLGLIRHPSVVLIIGARGSGKTAFGYNILEDNRWKGKTYVVGLSQKAQKFLPDWIGCVPSLEGVPSGSIALIDESYITYHARSSSSQRAREISNLINLSRQKELTLIFVSQESRQIDKNIVSSADVIIIKNPGILQLEFERPQLKKILSEYEITSYP